jgi:hypothetical protein
MSNKKKFYCGKECKIILEMGSESVIQISSEYLIDSGDYMNPPEYEQETQTLIVNNRYISDVPDNLFEEHKKQEDKLIAKIDELHNTIRDLNSDIKEKQSYLEKLSKDNSHIQGIQDMLDSINMNFEYMVLYNNRWKVPEIISKQDFMTTRKSQHFRTFQYRSTRSTEVEVFLYNDVDCSGEVNRAKPFKTLDEARAFLFDYLSKTEPSHYILKAYLNNKFTGIEKLDKFKEQADKDKLKDAKERYERVKKDLMEAENEIKKLDEIE